MSAKVKKSEIFDTNEDFRKVGDMLSTVIIIFGIAAVVIGILGAVTAKCFKKCCHCCVSIIQI
jgi:hypothetical protein